MVRFSLERDEEDDNNGEGSSSPNTRPVPKKRRTLTGTFSCCNAPEPEPELEPESEEEEEEEEEEYEADDYIDEEEEQEEEEEESEPELETDRELGSGSVMLTDPEGSREFRSIRVTLSDPDVLDCPICLESLSLPVFQCENGHIACSSCCIKIANKCPQCCWPIGYNRCRAIEKVLESVKVPCINKYYGCKETPSYSKKADHENTCAYAPLVCPNRECGFTGTTKELYAHFSDKHSSLAKQICFNFTHPIYIEKHQTHQILQERRDGTIFIINNRNERLGSAVHIICVRPSSEKRRFKYTIEAGDGDDTYKMESYADNVPDWVENVTPLRKFLLIPRDEAAYPAHLMLRVLIKDSD